MIIKATRIRVGGADALAKHLLRRDENETVRTLYGVVAETLSAAQGIAQAFGSKYAIRHFSISPEQALSRLQLKQVLKALFKEYKVADRPWTAVEHTKSRSDGSSAPHYHVCICECQPSTGRVLESSWSHPRNEYLARSSELAFGHEIVVGRHMEAVIRRLRDEGRLEWADTLAAAYTGIRPLCAFT